MTSFQRQELVRAKKILEQVLRDTPADDLPGAFRFRQLCEYYGCTANEIRSHCRTAEMVAARTKIIQRMHDEGHSIRELCELLQRTNWGIKHLLRKR